MAEPPNIPEVHDKRLKPPGILPRHLQSWVLGGVAALMVVVIVFSGGNAPKAQAPTGARPVTAVLPPSQDKLKDYERRIEEQAERLALEQAQLARTKQALGVPASQAASLPPTRSHGYGPSSPEARGEPTPPRSWIELENEKREYWSRFASNVALTYRNEREAPEPAPPFSNSPRQAPEGAPPDAWAQTSTPAAALNRATGKTYRLFEGTIIETVLTNRLDGSFSGPVNCMVTTDLYSHDHQRLLIPKGSRILGEVRHVENFGQQRLAVVFHRLIMPDGYSVNLDQFQGLNQIGETGLRDRVNRHYLQIFGASIAIGAIAGLAQANTRYGYDASPADAYRQGVAASLAQSSLGILDKFLNVLPTFTLREGHRIKVYLAQDVELPAYSNYDMPSDL